MSINKQGSLTFYSEELFTSDDTDVTPADSEAGKKKKVVKWSRDHRESADSAV